MFSHASILFLVRVLYFIYIWIDFEFTSLKKLLPAHHIDSRLYK